MEFPSGYKIPSEHTNKVCKLKKILIWSETISKSLVWKTYEIDAKVRVQPEQL